MATEAPVGVAITSTPSAPILARMPRSSMTMVLHSPLPCTAHG